MASQQKIVIGEDKDECEVIVLYEDQDYYDVIEPCKLHPESTDSTDCPPIPQDTITPTKKVSDCPDIGRGKYFPMQMFEDINPQPVDVLPKYLDGICLYLLETTCNTWTRKTSDLWYVKMVTSSKSGYHGYRKIGKCQGSWVCQNPYCSFKSTSFQNQPN